MSFLEELEKAKAQAHAQAADAWSIRFERVKGKVSFDGIERVTTQALFDILDVPQRGRTSGACKRLAAVMRAQGWSPIKARGLTSGFRNQVRGWAKDRRGTTVF
jgi:hypothetical protein